MDSFQIVNGVLSTLLQLMWRTFSINLVNNIKRECEIPWATAYGIFVMR